MSCASATGSKNRLRAGSPARSLLEGLPGGHAPAFTRRLARTADFSGRGLACAALCLAALGLAALTGCSTTKKGETPGKTVLAVKQGESSIQVTESELDGSQIVRINTKYRGEDHSLALQIDQNVYDVEIPLTLEQIAPQSASSAARGSEGQFQDMLIAQYFEKAQEAMLAGNYADALKNVNLVLLTRPDHAQGHAMKGSVYYAMGNYQLADEEWQRVLALDPGNQEVRNFTEFLKNRKGAPQPPLPGAPGATAQPKGTAQPKSAAPSKGAAQPPASPRKGSP